VGYAYLLWKKKKSCLKRKRARKQTEEEGKLRAIRKEDYRSKVRTEDQQERGLQF
jgi:hypothetical protein